MNIFRWEQVRNDLLDEIQTGRLRPGDRLPSISTLLARYDPFSQSTILHALNWLRDHGYIVSRQGAANYVADDAVTGMSQAEKMIRLQREVEALKTLVTAQGESSTKPL